MVVFPSLDLVAFWGIIVNCATAPNLDFKSDAGDFVNAVSEKSSPLIVTLNCGAIFVLFETYM